MQIPRVYWGSPVEMGQVIALSDDQVHHLRDVLRLVSGDKVYVLSKNGQFLAEITEIHKSRINLAILSLTDTAQKKHRVILCQAIPKSQRMDWIIEKTTELGVDEIIPVVSSRVVKKAEKITRWKKIAIHASKQCQRGDVPLIRDVTAWKDVVSLSGGWDLRLMATVGVTDRMNFFDLNFSALARKFFSVAVAIGPEGDFDESEITLAKSKGWLLMDLGPRVLRSDTAAVVGLSLIQYELCRRNIV